MSSGRGSRLNLAILLVLSGGSVSAQRPARPGVFDYYVLSLSWSPEHCSASSESPQCDGGRRYGFVVHGLWPQYERGYPARCHTPGRVPDPVARELLEIMPSRRLIEHEWATHGTCSGLNPRAYFTLVEDAWARVMIPADFRQPLNRVETTTAEIRRRFVAANPAIPGNSMAVVCRGRFLREVRVCYDRQLRPRPCSADVRDQCPNARIIMRPVR